MALSNNWTNIASGSQTINGAKLTYYIDAYLQSQSVANNQSVCVIRARTVFSGNYMQSYGYNFTATGCTSKSGSGLYNFTTETVLNGSTTVTHSADGTGSLSVSGVCQGSGLGLSISVSGSIALPTIPRASVPTVSTSAITLNGSDSVTVSTNRASSSFTHTLTFSIGEYSFTANNVGASYAFTPSVATLMPYMASKAMTVIVTCATYNGSTKIGSDQSTSFTLNVDSATYHPVISSVTLTDTNSTTAALESSGTFISGKSNLQVALNIGVSDSTYETLSRVTIKNGSTTRTVNLSGTSGTATTTFNGITSNSVTITVYDSRGTTAVSTRTVTLLPYSPVNIQSAQYERVNSSGVASMTGNKLKFKVKVTAYVGSFGQQSNTLTLSYQKKNGDTYDSAVTVGSYSPSSTGTVTTYTFNLTAAEDFSYSSQYELKLIVSDKLSSDNLSIIIHQGVPVAGWGETYFDVYGDFHIHNRENPDEYTNILNHINKEYTLYGTKLGMFEHTTSQIQGMTTDGTYLYCAGTDGDLNLVHIYKINPTTLARTDYVLDNVVPLEDDEEGVTYGVFGHPNSLDYREGKLYIAGCMRTAEVTTYRYICIVDITVTPWVASFATISGGVAWWSVAVLQAYNGKYVLAGHKADSQTIDLFATIYGDPEADPPVGAFGFNRFLPWRCIDIGAFSCDPAGMCQYNNYILIGDAHLTTMYANNCVRCFTSDGAHKANIYLPMMGDNELEDVCVIGNTLYIVDISGNLYSTNIRDVFRNRYDPTMFSQNRSPGTQFGYVNENGSEVYTDIGNGAKLTTQFRMVPWFFPSHHWITGGAMRIRTTTDNELVLQAIYEGDGTIVFNGTGKSGRALVYYHMKYLRTADANEYIYTFDDASFYCTAHYQGVETQYTTVQAAAAAGYFVGYNYIREIQFEATVRFSGGAIAL